MSAEQQPDPILPNYNPSSWDVPTLSPEERAILDTEYITFPIAQNQNITFPVAPTAPTLANGTNTTQVATTGFVQNAITVFKAATNIWSSLNTFNGGLIASSITRTGTLTITGSPLALSGARLDTPFSTNYTYPVASDKIGYILTGTFADVPNTTLSTDFQLASLLIPKGVWILQGSCGLNSATINSNVLIAINTTSSTTGSRARQSYIYQPTPANVTFSTNFIISINTDTTHYFMGISNQPISPAFSWNNITFQATRIA